MPRRRGAVTHGSSWTEDNTQDYISGSPLLKGGGGPPMIFPGGDYVGGGDPLSVRKPWGVINFVFTLKRFFDSGLKNRL